MRILQIIDSLHAGGAERMAINYANALANEIEFSGLVVTRKEGPLLNQINNNVSYLFLKKKSALDRHSVYKLRKFVIENKVEFIHAHSTSYFLAFLLKLTCPKIKLIWHDHYGNSEFLSQRPFMNLKIVSLFFKGSIAVNHKLKLWAQQKLEFENVIYLPNFTATDHAVSESTNLLGIQGKRIVLLANLRVQKNHFLVLEVAKKVRLFHPEWTFHLVGTDFDDDYSKKIKSLVLDYNLESTVFVYGSQNDVKNILEQAAIGILTSESEGLPLALLEYGLFKKPVVVTKVGEIPQVIHDGINGFLVDSTDGQSFSNSLLKLIESESLRTDFGKALQKTILDKYSQKAVLKEYITWMRSMR